MAACKISVHGSNAWRHAVPRHMSQLIAALIYVRYYQTDSFTEIMYLHCLCGPVAGMEPWGKVASPALATAMWVWSPPTTDLGNTPQDDTANARAVVTLSRTWTPHEYLLAHVVLVTSEAAVVWVREVPARSSAGHRAEGAHGRLLYDSRPYESRAAGTAQPTVLTGPDGKGFRLKGGTAHEFVLKCAGPEPGQAAERPAGVLFAVVRATDDQEVLFVSDEQVQWHPSRPAAVLPANTLPWSGPRGRDWRGAEVQWVWNTASAASGVPAHSACMFDQALTGRSAASGSFATLLLALDDEAVVWLNGRRLTSSSLLHGWRPNTHHAVGLYLHPGVNILTLLVKNSARPPPNPAGLAFAVIPNRVDGYRLMVSSDIQFPKTAAATNDTAMAQENVEELYKHMAGQRGTPLVDRAHGGRLPAPSHVPAAVIVGDIAELYTSWQVSDRLSSVCIGLSGWSKRHCSKVRTAVLAGRY